MCAGSETTLRGKPVNVYMGYYGGSLSIGDKYYSVNKGQGNVTQDEMIELLSKYKSKELATMIVELVRYSNE